MYQRFGLEYTEEFERRMMRYLLDNQQGKYGRHKYSMEEYGFIGADLYREYEEYRDRYGYGVPQKIVRPAALDLNLSLGI